MKDELKFLLKLTNDQMRILGYSSKLDKSKKMNLNIDNAKLCSVFNKKTLFWHTIVICENIDTKLKIINLVNSIK